jgi:hypothetical protein
MAVDPNSLTDPKLLRNLMENAKRAGRSDLVLQCQVRLAVLAGANYETPLEKDFWSAVTAAEELASEKNGRTTRLIRTRQKVKRVGIKKILEDWAFHKGTTQGFDILVEGGYPELTGEAIVVRHAAEFSEEVVAAARKRLSDRNIALDAVSGGQAQE